MMKDPHGFSRMASCRSFGGEGGAEFVSGSEEEDESNSDEEEVEVEAEEDLNFGSCILPERWDVLGLGQAMVIFLIFLILMFFFFFFVNFDFF